MPICEISLNAAAAPSSDAAGHASACANCETPLQGAYCHACGQSAHVHRSLLHLAEELLHGTLHFETKAWRTLPALLFQPGRLTREYIEGRRARYVSPLALFLFMVFLMFFTLSLGGPESAPAPEVAQETVATQAGASDAASAPERSLTPAQRVKLRTELEDKLPAGLVPGVEKKIAHAIENPELLLYKMKSGAAKYAFLIVPFSLPLLWLLFAFQRRFGLYDHAVFVLYSLSAMALLAALLSLLDLAGLGVPALLLAICAPPVHLYAQLKGSYGLGRFGALWRCGLLLLWAGAVLLLYTLLVVLISM